MPNYSKDELNRFLSHAESIHCYLSGTYMEKNRGKVLRCGESIEACAMRLVEICGYRKMETDESTRSSIKASMRAALGGFHASDSVVGYFLVSQGGKVRIFYGDDQGNMDIRLDRTAPDVRLNKNPALNVCGLARYGGLVAGIGNITEAVADQLLDSMEKKDSIVALIAKPKSVSTVKRYCDALRELRNKALKIKETGVTYGSGSRQVLGNHFSPIDGLDVFLQSQIQRLESNVQSIWEGCIWFGSEEREHACYLGETLSGIYGGNTSVDNVCWFLTASNPLEQGALGFADNRFGTPQYGLADVLIKSPLISYMTGEELAGAMQLPLRSHIGFSVGNYDVGKNEIDLFEINPPRWHLYDSTIHLGRVNNNPYMLQLNSLVRHMLVVGASGSGKTNTVMQILRAVNAHKIPFCVIEVEKKNYIKLLDTVEDLKVYSCGGDGLELELNPFEPEIGVYIGNHIDDIIVALGAAFEMEEATRLAMKGLIKYVYDKMGWSSQDVAYPSEKRYPMVKDMKDNLDEYAEKELKYGREVNSNVVGSVLNRLNTLQNGGAGRHFAGKNAITGRVLCTERTVIELDDLNGATKTFISALLIMRIKQYVKTHDATDKLKNLLVVEEAHNVFTSELSQERERIVGGRYISDLLSTIREYGTGVIIADQSVSAIHSSAIANTEVKIVHRTTKKEDIDAVRYALQLSSVQQRVFPDLNPGEAIIKIAGVEGTNRVRIDRAMVATPKNVGCIFCDCRQFCEGNDVSRKLESARVDIDFVAASWYNNRFHANRLGGAVSSFMKRYGISAGLEICAMGWVLGQSRIECGISEKRKMLYTFAGITRKGQK